MTRELLHKPHKVDYFMQIGKYRRREQVSNSGYYPLLLKREALIMLRVLFFANSAALPGIVVEVGEDAGQVEHDDP